MTLHTLSFVVDGTPVTQGSMNPGRNGKMFHKKTLAPWRAKVLDAALEAADALDYDLPIPREIPVCVQAAFVYKRPKNPKYGFPARADVDKLQRAVGDALSVGDFSILTDDDQIQWWYAQKVYAVEEEGDCALITLTWEA